jgi:glycosyltransferase involved in cell wall biosynthesis
MSIPTAQVGINASSVVGARTGIGQATAALLGGMARHWPEAWPRARAWINSRRHSLPENDAWIQSGAYEVIHTRWPGRALLRSWQYMKWPPVEKFIGSADLFHAPASYIPPPSRSGKIVTVHDIYFQYAPGDVEPYGGGYFNQTFHRLHEAKKIIAISGFTRKELLKFYPLDPDRIVIIPQGVDHDRFSGEEEERDLKELESLGIEQPYLLCVATREPRKNMTILLEGYARADRVLKAGRQRIPPLVIAGSSGWGQKEINRILEEGQIREKVILTGYLPDPVIPALYRHAMLYIMPSLYEGFGMPVLESMSCGCPTLLAEIDVFREVAGDAAVYFNPHNSALLARQLVTLVGDHEQRADLREAGFTRAEAYTWDSTAKSTIDVYREALEQKGPG